MFGADKDLSTFSGVLPIIIIIIIVKNGISDHRRVSMSESRSQNSKNNASALHLRTFCTLPLHFRALALAFIEADMAQR